MSSSISNKILLLLVAFRTKEEKGPSSSFQSSQQNRYSATGRNHEENSSSRNNTNIACVISGYFLKTILFCLIGTICFFGLYYAVSSPPMHWFYDVASSPAGPNSVYLPGGGFSGFWFHLGYLHSLPKDTLHEHDYYCYSAGCLSILSVFLNRSLEEVYNAASASQNAWMNNNNNSSSISRFDIIEYFFDELVPSPLPISSSSSSAQQTTRKKNDEVIQKQQQLQETNSIVSSTNVEQFLPRIKILVTTMSDGYQVLEATNRQELKDLIIKTTWVPYLTGWGFLWNTYDTAAVRRRNNYYNWHVYYDMYLDGGFSRMLHPLCDIELSLPIIYETVLYTFTPSLTYEQVRTLWKKGYEYDYGYNKNNRQLSSYYSSSFDDADDDVPTNATNCKHILNDIDFDNNDVDIVVSSPPPQAYCDSSSINDTTAPPSNLMT